VANRQLFKYCFDICTKYANDELSISEYFEIIKKTGMKSVSFYKIALSYGAVVEKINKEQLALMTIQIQPSNKVLNLLEKTEDSNEILKLLTLYGEYKEKGISFGNERLKDLNKYIKGYFVRKPKNVESEEDYQSRKDSLINKISNVLNYYNKITTNSHRAKIEKRTVVLFNKRLTNCRQLINEFIKADMSLDKFVLSKGITKRDFWENLYFIKMYDNNLYLKYYDYLENKQLLKKGEAVVQVYKIIDGLKNGVLDSRTNKIRPFDILDYFEITDLNYSNLVNYTHKILQKQDLQLLKDFFVKNQIIKIREKEILNSKFIIKNQEIKTEDKIEIINYLNSINAPLTLKLLKVAFDRYLNNELNMENSLKYKP